MPSACTGKEIKRISGKLEPKDISASYIERQNLTMRMHIRRFTRLTNVFSKKMEIIAMRLPCTFVYDNFCKINKTLRVTLAVEAGLRKVHAEIDDIVTLAD